MFNIQLWNLGVRKAVSGEMPLIHTKRLEAAKKFYSVATTDTDIQTKLARLAITADS